MPSKACENGAGGASTLLRQVEARLSQERQPAASSAMTAQGCRVVAPMCRAGSDSGAGRMLAATLMLFSIATAVCCRPWRRLAKRHHKLA